MHDTSSVTNERSTRATACIEIWQHKGVRSEFCAVYDQMAQKMQESLSDPYRNALAAGCQIAPMIDTNGFAPAIIAMTFVVGALWIFTILPHPLV